MTSDAQIAKVLVAGASGHLGKEVVREFKERGYWIRALARNPGKLVAVKHLIDDIFLADVTLPGTLEGACEGIDIVFSCVGQSVSISRIPNKDSYRDVDYQGNKNLLGEAAQSKAQKFIYVAVFGVEWFAHLEYFRAHEDFVKELRRSGLEHTVVRPTAFFSVYYELLKMIEKSGSAYVVGDGQSRINPIHEADLAVLCADIVTRHQSELAAGGPKTYTRNELAELAFSTLAKEPKITTIPPWIFNTLVKAIGLFDTRLANLAQFGADAMQIDCVAPAVGSRSLGRYLAEKNRRSLI